jgi:hypothetical protein
MGRSKRILSSDTTATTQEMTNHSSVAACVFSAAVQIFLSSRCLATTGYKVLKGGLCEVHRLDGVGVLLAADSQSTSSSGYQASLWDP